MKNLKKILKRLIGRLKIKLGHHGVATSYANFYYVHNMDLHACTRKDWEKSKKDELTVHGA